MRIIIELTEANDYAAHIEDDSSRLDTIKGVGLTPHAALDALATAIKFLS